MSSTSKGDLGEGIMETFDPGLRRAFDNAGKTVDASLINYDNVRIHKDSLLLSGDGAFYTLQGEGPTMGLPCVFVRLHVCNLKCDWCDAQYTWDARTEEFWTEGWRLPFQEVAKMIWNTWEGPQKMQKRVIFTGGEPLIQRRQIDQVVAHLNVGDYPTWSMEIETNGTLMPTEFELGYAQFNCSPKLLNSNNLHHSMVKPKVLAALNEVNTTFKFVCMTPADLNEIEEKYLPHIDHHKVIIMPQGVMEEEVSQNAKVLAEPCKERGFRLMPRLQNICWDGARRGV